MRQHLRIERTLAAALGVACTFYSGQSGAATIVAPVTAFATSEFISSSGNDYSIGNTIDQSGLSLRYVSGLTDFDSYLASKPKHTSNANGNEWFSQDYSKASPNLRDSITKGRLSKKNLNVGDLASARGKRSAGKASKKNRIPKSSTSSTNGNLSAISSAPLVSITYGFSGPIAINGFVLWNEEFAGIGTTQLLSSIDGITYTLLSTITPTPSKFAPTGKVFPYLAQVFSFDLTTMLFFKLLIYDCPGPPANQSSYRGCGIGEVAFSAVPPGPLDSPPIPLPAALPLLASALALFAWFGRRSKNFN